MMKFISGILMLGLLSACNAIPSNYQGGFISSSAKTGVSHLAVSDSAIQLTFQNQVYDFQAQNVFTSDDAAIDGLMNGRSGLYILPALSGPFIPWAGRVYPLPVQESQRYDAFYGLIVRSTTGDEGGITPVPGAHIVEGTGSAIELRVDTAATGPVNQLQVYFKPDATFMAERVKVLWQLISKGFDIGGKSGPDYLLKFSRVAQ